MCLGAYTERVMLSFLQTLRFMVFRAQSWPRGTKEGPTLGPAEGSSTERTAVKPGLWHRPVHTSPCV